MGNTKSHETRENVYYQICIVNQDTLDQILTFRKAYEVK